MSNDGTNYRPWKVRKGIFKSTGTSDYSVPPRNTPSPIIEMPLSPVATSTPCSPLSPMSPRVIIAESPLSPPIVTSPPISTIHINIREIPIKRDDEVSVLRFSARIYFLWLKREKSNGVKGSGQRKMFTIKRVECKTFFRFRIYFKILRRVMFSCRLSTSFS